MKYILITLSSFLLFSCTNSKDKWFSHAVSGLELEQRLAIYQGIRPEAKMNNAKFKVDD